MINISSNKTCSLSSFLLWLSATLKLDLLKSPGKSGSARPPRGMKLGNDLQAACPDALPLNHRRLVGAKATTELDKYQAYC